MGSTAWELLLGTGWDRAHMLRGLIPCWEKGHGTCSLRKGHRGQALGELLGVQWGGELLLGRGGTQIWGNVKMQDECAQAIG